MLIDWTKHLKDPEEKKRFEAYVWSCRQVFQRQLELLEEKEREITAEERDLFIYENNNWAYRQAHRNGSMQMIKFLKNLVDLDQQKEPNRDR